MVVSLRYDEFRQILRSMARDGSPDLIGDFDHPAIQHGWPSWDALWPDDCAKFIIDGVDIYDDKVVEFGVQMAYHKALQFPAKSTFIQWRALVSSNSESYHQDTALFVQILSSDEQHLKVGFLHGSINPLGRGFDLPFAVNLYGDKAATLINSDGDDLSDRDLTLKTYIEEMLAFLSILACKGLKRETVAPSHRQQARRSKKGMPPLPSFVRVSTTVSEIEIEAEQHGFLRSSPRPHFRRGHVRTLYRNTEGQRIVVVSPTWVNAEPGEVPIRPYMVME